MNPFMLQIAITGIIVLKLKKKLEQHEYIRQGIIDNKIYIYLP